MFVVCIVLSVVLVRLIQKQKQSLPSSQRLSNEAVNVGHMYETVTSAISASADRSEDGAVTGNTDQHGVFSPEIEVVRREVEATTTTQVINNQDLSNIDFNYQNISPQDCHSNSSGSTHSASTGLCDDFVYPHSTINIGSSH